MTSHKLPGEYIELAVAAQLVRIRLVPDGLRRCDRRNLFMMLDAAAQALTRVATLYVPGEEDGERRALTARELEGALACEGGNVLVLKDGRRLTGVSIWRHELSDAITLLRAIGVRGLGD